MIQDIFPYHLDNHYDPEVTPAPESLVIVFREKELLLSAVPGKYAVPTDSDQSFSIYPKVRDFKGLEESDLTYLFSIGDEQFFLLNKGFENIVFAPEAAPLSESEEFCHLPRGKQFVFSGIRELRSLAHVEKRYVFAAYTAWQLAEWYDVTRFCGRCGSLNENDKKERARRCPNCGNIIYPRINPAVIIGVTDPSSNRLILTKYRTGFAHNALVAGFTEIGETLEETVSREVMEEVGLKVKNIRYYKSQPWGIASDILAGFYCDVDGDTAIRMDESELKYAEWVAPEDVVLQPMAYSLTNEMMKLFKDGGYKATL
jgi:NAD+ diphosphatase